MRVFIASFNRATSCALDLLIKKLKEKDMHSNDSDAADYIMAVADRTETYDAVLNLFKKNKPIIHLWAGEKSCWATHDDVWRHSMTLMSDMQMCTNDVAKERVEKLCRAVGKEPNAHVVGNVYLDSLETDPSFVPEFPVGKYDVVLYNPVTRGTEEDVMEDIQEIKKHLEKPYLWIMPNGDKYSNIVAPYVTHETLPRAGFLSLLKSCRRFITNSSCQYFEAPFVMDKDRIISIGKRNIERESRYSDMTIPNASDNIIKLLEELK